jgi:hypothetical protein
MRALAPILLAVCLPACAEAPPRPDSPAACVAHPPALGPDGQLLKELTKDEVVPAIGRLKASVANCYELFHQQGLFTTSITVAPSGEVEAAVPVGPLAGTPTATCVAGVMQHACFPSFGGPPKTFQYPFMLR